MRIERIILGDFEIFGLSDGHFSLDGGAMFGIVPKVLWETRCPADDKNRIKLSLNSLLIKMPKAVILVETGIGNKLGQKYDDIYCLDKEAGLLRSLKEIGVEPPDVDFVINTHLHFDHCGWNTVKDEKGGIVPTFPNARYIVQKGEWEAAVNPNEREKPSYLPENFLPLERAGVLQLVEGDRTISEGGQVILAGGHTSHHQCVKIQSREKILFCLGDLVPTSSHVGLSYIMSYDLFPLDTLKNKKQLFERAIRENWILAFVHDPLYYFGKVKKSGQRYEFEPLKSDVWGTRT